MLSLQALSGILPNNNGNLGMNLQSGNTVNDPDARLCHLFGGQHVILLVKASLQFNKYSHLFPILRRADKCIYHCRIFGNAVLCNLYLIHFRIESRFHQQTDQVVERLIWEVKQYILLFDSFYNRSDFVQVGNSHG